ncbi:MAG: hypothetical protein WB441_11465, partial [Nocardioidaceae bacterium]
MPTRLLSLTAAGLVDSLFWSMAWTLVILQVTAEHGLVAAGVCGTAMLLGVALSAPAAGALSRRLDGRRLLRRAVTVEALLRAAVVALLLLDGPLWLLAAVVVAMNVAAWTGYAGMRAEVSAVVAGAAGLTWYGTVVAAVEATGVAVAALLPVVSGVVPRPVLLAVGAAYVLSLLPTAVVAGGSRVPRAVAPAARNRLRRRRASAPDLGGAVLMFAASAPTLLSVALAAHLHGRSAVGPAAVAFTLGSLAAPLLASRIQAGGRNGPVAWVLCATGMVAGWALAPYSVVLMCVAQVLSGVCLTALEGLLDAGAAQRHPGQVTAALARATAGRALGSAAGTA